MYLCQFTNFAVGLIMFFFLLLLLLLLFGNFFRSITQSFNSNTHTLAATFQLIKSRNVVYLHAGLALLRRS